VLSGSIGSKLIACFSVARVINSEEIGRESFYRLLIVSLSQGVLDGLFEEPSRNFSLLFFKTDKKSPKLLRKSGFNSITDFLPIFESI